MKPPGSVWMDFQNAVSIVLLNRGAGSARPGSYCRR